MPTWTGEQAVAPDPQPEPDRPTAVQYNGADEIQKSLAQFNADFPKSLEQLSSSAERIKQMADYAARMVLMMLCDLRILSGY